MNLSSFQGRRQHQLFTSVFLWVDAVISVNIIRCCIHAGISNGFVETHEEIHEALTERRALKLDNNYESPWNWGLTKEQEMNV